jgi:protein translocase SecG subunit
MAHTLHVIQIVSALALIVLVLFQSTSGDMGSNFGGDNSSFLQTRRGSERFFFILTVILAVVFAGASLAVIVLTK